MAEDELDTDGQEPDMIGGGTDEDGNVYDEGFAGASPRILAVDDSRLVRAVITACLNDSGYETLEADNGKTALDLLETEDVELILLDIMMPTIDGPTFLAMLRERGDPTPVILLTGKTETKVIARCIRQGISDFILKPVKQDELLKKIAGVVGPGSIVAEPAAAVDATEDDEEQFSILIVDDSENVAERLRSLLPEKKVWLENTTTGEQTLSICRDMKFNTIIVDTVIPGEDSAQLTEQIRNLQPAARVFALYLRNVSEPMQQALQDGYDGYLAKPFNQEQVNNLCDIQPEVGDVLVVEQNILHALPSIGQNETIETYFSRLGELVGPAIEGIASDCFEKIVFDFSEVPDSEIFPIFVESTLLLSRELGLEACVVGESPYLASLKDEEINAPVFTTVDEVKESGDWA